MKPRALADAAVGNLQLELAPAPAAELAVRCAGTADMHAIEQLDGFLGELHRLALERASRSVSVDLRDLEFMNSSCFKCFVSWIGQVSDLAPGQQYRIEFLSNPQMQWQRRSLNALRCFAMQVVGVHA